MKTLFVLSPAQGTLGESALLTALAVPTENSIDGCELLDNDAARSERAPSNCAVVLLIFPTVNGLMWAQRQKNQWILSGVAQERIVPVLCFDQESGALPRSIIANTLGLEPLIWRISLSRLLWINNDRTPVTIGTDAAVQTLVEQINARLASAWTSEQNVAVPWASIEKEVLKALWENWNADAPLEQRVRHHMAAVLAQHRLSQVDASLLNQLERRLLDHLTGLGPLEPFLRDPDVNEIMINGTARLFVEKSGAMITVPPPFDHETHLKTLIERIVSPSGRRVDWAAPFCDVRLNDGSRVNIVLPPLSLDGPCVTIRRFRPGFTSMDELIKMKTVSREQAQVLESSVRQRRNIVIAGNTGAGKTTLLNVLASFIPDSERILTLEDAAELRILKPHVVRLETRPANTEGMGRITMRDLVINALRMRPDRLLVGECRGDEVIPMLQAMNTGHDGSMTTIHANSADEVRPRLESLVSMAAPGWSLDLVRQQIESAVDVAVFIKRDGSVRRVMEISDVV